MPDSVEHNVDLERFQCLLNQSEGIRNEASYEFDINENQYWCSDNFYKIFGLKKNDDFIDKKTFLSLIHPDDQTNIAKAFQSALEGDSYSAQIRMLHDGGAIVHVKAKGSIIYNEMNEPVKLAVTLFDISQQEGVKAKLVESEAKFKKVFESFVDVYYEVNSKEIIEVISPSVYGLLGYKPEELIGTDQTDKFKNPKERISLKKQLKKEGHVENFIATIYNKKGEEIIMEINVRQRYDQEGKPDGEIGVARDVTQRIKQDSQLQEKEILLKEIHHRVKNNLQIVSSLLSLQSEQIRNEKYNEMFRTSQQRVASIALVHQQLYQAVDLKNVSVRHYVTDLIDKIKATTKEYSSNIETFFEIDDIKLPTETIVPVGLIVNEVVVNCYKYAFEDIKDPKLTIKFTIDGDKKRLMISDNGKGIDGLDSILASNSLGMQLIDILTDQIDGKLKIDTGKNKGVKYTIDFT